MRAKAASRSTATGKAGQKSQAKTSFKSELIAAPTKEKREAHRRTAPSAELAKIVARVSEWAGGPLQARAWCQEVGIPALGGLTAQELVEAGQAQSVWKFLDHIAVGGFA